MPIDSIHLDSSIQRMNLAEKEELAQLGYTVTKEGDVIAPETRSLWQRTRDIWTGWQEKRKNEAKAKNALHTRNRSPLYSRREILSLGAKTAAVAGGLALNVAPALARYDEDEAPQEPSVTEKTAKDIQETLKIAERVRINSKETEINGRKTFVFADRLAFYTHAADPAGDWQDHVPQSNEEMYERKSASAKDLGFVERPSFFVIHTDGGNDIGITAQSLNNRNIQCQFLVGLVDGEATSIQTTYLTEDAVNISGTVGGSPENSYDANFQFWGSLNVEIQGWPDKIDDRLYDKVVELAMQVMPLYDLKISEVIGHLEVPNNGKADPGRNVLREVRTRIYLELIKRRMFSLIDVFPQDRKKLEEVFEVGKYLDGPAELTDSGRVKCWMKSSDDFVDWDRIREVTDADRHISRAIQEKEDNRAAIMRIENVVGEEIWMGFPESFVEWLTTQGRPLANEKFIDYRKATVANFMYRFLQHAPKGFHLGKPLGLKYEQIKNLAELFILNQPYESRNNKGVTDDQKELANAFVNIAERVNTHAQEDNLKTIRYAYQRAYRTALPEW
jgi:hypothetical protein